MKMNRAKVLFPLSLFLILVLPIATVLLSPSQTQAQDVFESFKVSDYNYVTVFGGTLWMAQTFTATSTHTITSVRLKLYREGTPGDITLSIRATDSNGLPSGPDLASGSLDGNLITEGFPREMVRDTTCPCYDSD